MPTYDNTQEMERIIEEACVNMTPIVNYKKKNTIHIELDTICIILSCVMMLVACVVMMINIHYMNVLSEMVDQETEEIVEIVESTPAPDNIGAPSEDSVNTDNDILTEMTENIPVIETEPETTPEATEAPVTVETTPVVDPDELEMLACVIYQEAGGNGSCDDCRRYVADIVLNRVEHDQFPNTMEDVLTAKRQYGRFYWTGIKWPDRAKYDTEKDAVDRAYRIAEEVLSGQHSKLYGEGYIWQAAHVQGTDGFWCCGHYYGR